MSPGFFGVDVIFVIKVFHQTEATVSLMLLPMPIQAKFDILSFLKSELCSSITANKKCIFFEEKKMTKKLFKSVEIFAHTLYCIRKLVNKKSTKYTFLPLGKNKRWNE